MPPMSGRAFFSHKAAFLGGWHWGVSLDSHQVWINPKKPNFLARCLDLLIKPYWGNKILDGHKTIELRAQNTNFREERSLWPCSGTGLLQGTVEIVDSFNPNTGYGFII